MGNLFDELIAESKQLNGPACSIARVKALMSEDERADLEKVLSESAIYGSAIGRKLSALYGWQIKGQTVQRHRNGECSCG